MPFDKLTPEQLTSPVAKPDYASEAAMIADQENQVSGWFYHDGTSYWQYLGTTLGTIADYRGVGANGIDENAVHYNTDDNKSAIEKQQARTNIGLDSSEPQFLNTSGILGIVSKTSNYIIYTGAATAEISGFSSGILGETLAFYNSSDFNVSFILSATGNQEDRVGFAFTLRPKGTAIWRYTGDGTATNNRWRPDGQIVDGQIILNEINAQGGSGSFNSAAIKAIATNTSSFPLAWGDGLASMQSGVKGSGAIFLGIRSEADERSVVRRDELWKNYDVGFNMTSDINDYNIGLTRSLIRAIPNAAWSLTGVAGGENGRILYVYNDSNFDLIIPNESTSSLDINRFSIGEDLIISPRTYGAFLYYGARWRLSSIGGGGGSGVPAGGLTGEVLTKLSNADGDATWQPVEGVIYLVPFSNVILMDKNYKSNHIQVGPIAYTRILEAPAINFKNQTIHLIEANGTGGKPTFSADFEIQFDSWSNNAGDLNQIVFEVSPSGKILVWMFNVELA